MSNIRPKSLRVKTRLKPRVHLFGGSTRKSRAGFKFDDKSITEFLSEHSLSEFLEVDDVLRRVKLLTELTFVIKSSKDSELREDNIFKEIFRRVSHCRFNDDYRVRTLTIRIVRLLTLTNDRIILLLQHNFWTILLRGLDLIELVEEERMECLKLVSKILSHYYGANFAFKRLLSSEDRFRLFFRYSLKCLVSIALTQYTTPKEASSDGNSRRDESNHCSQRLSVTALGILLEAAVYEPFLVVQFIGTNWLVQCFETFYSVNIRISSLAHQIFAKWIDSPQLREFAELHLVLQQVSAPFIDLGFFQQPPKDTNSASFFKMSEGLEACVQALSDIMRTWSGLFSCIAAENTANELNTRLHASSPLRIIPYLGLSTLTNNGLKMRNVIVDAYCEFVGAPYASKTFSNWPEAISFYSQMHLPDAYKRSLRDDFVVGEMASLMGNREVFTNDTDLLLCFRSVTAFALIEAGVIQALCRLVIMHPDDVTSIKATLLLSDFLNLASTCLPREWRLRTMAVPDLIRSAAENFFQHSTSIFTPNASEMSLFSPKSFSEDIKFHNERRTAKNSTANNIDTFGNVFSSTSHHRFFYNNSDSQPDHSTASNNVENSFLLFNRLDKLNEISLFRNSSPLLDQLQDINIFLLNGTCKDELTSGRTCASPLSVPILIPVDSELSALEQSLLDVSNKLYFNATNTSAPNSSGDAFVSDSIKELSEANNLQSINWRFVDQLLQIIESTRASVIAEMLQKSSKLTERCHTFFTAVCSQFLPSNQLLVRNYSNTATNFDVLHAINCGRRAFNFAAQQISTSSNASNTFTNLYGREEEMSSNSSSFHVDVMASSSEQAFYVDLIRTFAVDFCAELSGINTYTGTFTPKNLLNTNALYYFAIIRILVQYDSGFKILEKSGLFQIFFDLILNHSESIEYTKLIVTSLNYSRSGISRVILRTAISSNDKKVRKWTTRFLNILIGLSGDNFGNSSRRCSTSHRTSSLAGLGSSDAESDSAVEFALRLAIHQLSDESPKIVRHALKILTDWLPHKPRYIGLLEFVNMELYGNAGRILEAIHYGVEENLNKHSTKKNIKNDAASVLEYWMKQFNERYVEILEEDMRRLGLNVKRSVSGRFARPSHGKAEKWALCAPPHFLGSLASHRAGRKLLARQKIVQKLLIELRAFLEKQSCDSFQQAGNGLSDESVNSYEDDDASECDNQYEEFRCRRVKASLLALSQIVRGYGNSVLGHDKFDEIDLSSLLADGLALTVEFASRCEWLTVRGCAFWALNIAGCSEFGAKILSEFGWECAAKDPPQGSTRTASKANTMASLFVLGKFVSIDSRSRKNGMQLRQRSSSASYTIPMDRQRKNHFLRRTASIEGLLGDCALNNTRIVDDEVTPSSAPPRELTTQLRENKTSSQANYLFLSEDEQSRLISYRNLLAEIEDSESNVAEESFVRPRITDLAIKQRRTRIPFPIIHLPTQISNICMNVFTSRSPKILALRRKILTNSTSNASIFSHSKLRCLYCSMRSRETNGEIPQNVCDAYKRRGAEILRLIERLQVRIVNRSEESNRNAKTDKDSAAAKSNEKREDRTNSTLTTQMRLLRIYSEFPHTFEHPCLFSNVLAIIAESNLNSAHRRFVHQLFWKAQI